MLKKTPVSISYEATSGATENVRFHAVMSEAHQASSEVTKYPTQLGYNVSNTAIRKNNVVTLVGIVTNTVLQDQDPDDFNSTDNSALMFKILRGLVNNSTPCKVVTNLGVYNRVIFDKFRTKQEAGSMDSLKFTLSGQEVQTSNSANKAAPNRVEFTKLLDEELLAKVDELSDAGFQIPTGADISTALVDLGSDFIVATENAVGDLIDTTYISQGYDAITDSFNYLVHTDAVEMFLPDDGEFDFFSLIGDLVDVSAGVTAAGACLSSGGNRLVGNTVDDLIETAMGKFTNSTYGIKFEAMSFLSNGDPVGGKNFGQSLIGLGVDCIIAGGTESVAGAEKVLNSSLPPVSEILSGAVTAGKNAVSGLGNPTRSVTFNKIAGLAGLDGTFGDAVKAP